MQKLSEGFEYLDGLARINGKPMQSFESFSRYLEKKAREKGVPLNGQFELTPLCNFDCKMCYVHLDGDQLKGREILPVPVWKELMTQAWKAGMVKAALTGGECLAYPGFDELFLHLQSLGCEVPVMTNGLLLDEKRVEFFRKHRPACLQITLYGWNDDVYERVTGRRAFGTVLENVRRAMDAGLNVRLTVTPNRFLGEDVLETVRLGRGLAKDFHVNSAIFVPREETGRSHQRDDPDPDQYIRIARVMNEGKGRPLREIEAEKLPPIGGPHHTCAGRGLRCGGGRSSFVITWEGTLQPCSMLDTIRAYPLKDGFEAAWAKINREANDYPRIPECEGCAYKKACPICAVILRQYAGPGKRPAALCETVRYYVQHGVMQIPACEDPPA